MWYVGLFVWCVMSYFIWVSQFFTTLPFLLWLIGTVVLLSYPVSTVYFSYKWQALCQSAISYKCPSKYNETIDKNASRYSARRSEFTHANSQRRRISWLVEGKKALVIVNPFGGSRNGIRIYEDILAPMFKRVEIPFDNVITTHSSHAFEIGKTVDRKVYCAIIVISGDGTCQNVLQGISAQCNEDIVTFRQFFEDFAISIVPGGTSNGLALSLNFTDPFVAVKNIIEGSSKFIDVMRLSPMNKSIDVAARWDLHTFNWGFASEVDYLLEKKLRWMPKSLREIYAPMRLMLENSTYKYKRFAIKPVGVSENDIKVRHYNDPEELKADQVHEGWRLIEGDISFLCGCNTSIAAEGVRFAPYKRLNEGAIDVTLTKDIKRWQSISIFLFEAPTGNQVRLPYFYNYKVTELEFVPQDNIHIDSSGEGIEWGQDGISLKVYGDIVRMIYSEEPPVTVTV